MAKRKIELLCDSCDIQFQVVVSDEYSLIKNLHSFNCAFCGDDIRTDGDDEGEDFNEDDDSDE